MFLLLRLKRRKNNGGFGWSCVLVFIGGVTKYRNEKEKNKRVGSVCETRWFGKVIRLSCLEKRQVRFDEHTI